MNEKKDNTLPQPPKLIGTIMAGFNITANHVTLIALPVLLDLLLWFGPHLRVKSLLMPLIEETSRSLQGANSPQFQSIMQSGQEAWQILTERINLAMFLRTFPVGLFSLMFGNLPVENPLGVPMIFETASFAEVVSWWIVFTLLGVLLGSLFFAIVSQAALQKSNSLTLGTLGWFTLQSLGLSVLLLVILIGFSLPIICLASFLTMINPAITYVVLLIAGGIMIWILSPLIFTPHGIFGFQLGLWRSVQTSVRLVRMTLPGTTLFIVCALIINQGLDMLWTTPPDTSWMALVGILGHAFITTSLLAASFIYYRDALQWAQAMVQRANPPAPTT